MRKQFSFIQPEIHPEHSPDLSLSPDPKGRLQRIVDLFPRGQFVRYICVGLFNTAFAYFGFASILTLLNAALPPRWLYLTVIVASVLSMPLNITVSYLGYKFFVFRTKGNYLREWLKCFAVYGAGAIPGLIALSALTRYLQSIIHGHAMWLHALLRAVQSRLNGSPLRLLQHVANVNLMAGYIAGAVVIGISTIYSFIGHKKFTFRTEEVASKQTLS